jgi:hypothetical protein
MGSETVIVGDSVTGTSTTTSLVFVHEVAQSTTNTDVIAQNARMA